jgi:hypothetical protein
METIEQLIRNEANILSKIYNLEISNVLLIYKEELQKYIKLGNTQKDAIDKAVLSTQEWCKNYRKGE